MNREPTTKSEFACVILAHADPVHLRRLIDALEPFPIFLHIDARTSDATFDAMTENLPARCRLLQRRVTGWAQWGLVEAELDGYREALRSTDATHIGLFSGSDYPLASTEVISKLLDEHLNESFAVVNELPYPAWGRTGGLSRLRYRHWAFRKHMLRLPIPRRVPRDIRLAGGSQSKVLAREHAAAVIRAVDQHEELVRFWRRTWVPDETFVYSVLNSPRFAQDWKRQLVPANLWWIGWSATRRKSPPWLNVEHRDILLRRRTSEDQQIPFLFARKFSTEFSTPILDAIDGRSSCAHPETQD